MKFRQRLLPEDQRKLIAIMKRLKKEEEKYASFKVDGCNY
jgi:hypothetical protein